MSEDYDDNVEFSNNPKKPLLEEGGLNRKKKYIIICSVFLIIVIIGIIILIIKNLGNKKDENKKDNDFIVLKYDKDISRPNISFNAEFELVKVKNGMTGLLINDKYSLFSYLQIHVPNGSYIDTIGGLAHFDEHMIFGGSEKYEYYSMFKKILGINGLNSDAITDGTFQNYYICSLNHFKFDKAIEILIDGFRYPLYNEEIIKKEIQPINSEFYLRKSGQGNIMLHIIRQLSSNKTSFNGFASGNNNTLNPNDSLNLSKKLKSYHMVVNKPENLFFILLSNKTINELEKDVSKYFNYEMHEFSDNEIDVEEKRKLEENIKNLKEKEIFDEKLYQHGIYYNSNIKQNILNILFHIGKIDYKDLQFDIIDYYHYLFNSKSLLNILKEKDYIVNIDRIKAESIFPIENNNVFTLNIILTEIGVKNIEEILLIIFKYIEILKKEGYQNKYFNNYIKYKQNQAINNFQKSYFQRVPSYYYELADKYTTSGDNQIFTLGIPSENNYNESKLKEYLNKINYEKSFFTLNLISNINKLDSIFIKSPIIQKLKYFDIEYIYGEIPSDLKNKINDNSIIITNLTIREINPYFSEKYEKVIPCYKQNPNNCKELNEFDFEKEDEYNGTILKDNNTNYITYYQIDKSSESFIVNSFLEFSFNDNELFNNNIMLEIETSYIINKLSPINELEIITPVINSKLNIGFKIKSFSDNTEIIIKDFIKYLFEEPKEEEVYYLLNTMKNEIIKNIPNSFNDYIMNIGKQFINKGISVNNNYEIIIQYINNIKFDQIKKNHILLINNINSVLFKIAGNINQTLVESIHNYLKENIIINKNNSISSKTRKLDSNLPYVINYYQKSNMTNEDDNGILVIYQYEQKYQNYMEIFSKCLHNVVMPFLRFKYSNAYNPRVILEGGALYIYEQGRYRDVTQMEDDINKVLLGMINGTIQCENYNDIIESYKLKANETKEKTSEYLFNNFINKKKVNNIELKDVIYHNTLSELMKEISPVFLEPKRYTMLIARKDLSDEDYEEMVKNRINTAKYIINENITIEHTKKIDYLNK